MKWILLWMLTLVSSHANASVEASTQIRSYDDGETQVISPLVELDATFNRDEQRVGVGATTDILTSASSDVRTFSSKGKIKDDRMEFSGDFETRIEDGSLGFGYIQSDERDYHSKIVSASASKEFFQKNTIFRFGFTNGQDIVADTTDPAFEEPMNHQNYSLSVEQVANKKSVVQLIYDLRVESGFIQSPYRRAKVKDVDGFIQPSLSERHPKTRNRNALAVKYNFYAEKLRVTFATTYRFYMDSWEVRSHTLEERVTKDLSDSLSLAFTIRYYTQSAASFFKDYYIDGEAAPFRTGNSTLSDHDSILLGVRPYLKLSESWSIYAKYEMFLQNFRSVSDAGDYFNANDDKILKTNAQIIGAGMTVKF